MADLKMFIPLTKVDVPQRLVYGLATAEAEDAAKEVCDYASTKPYYEKWSSDIAKVTDGKSFGNLRAMHGPVAAGKVTSINFNDADKQIEICAKVVDDAEWNKVLEGVYTGFSQGGAYVKRWKDEESGVQRYTANPHEISLVDLPCLPTATFSVIKSDGAVELRKFHTREVEMPTNIEIAAKAVELAKAAGRDSWGEYVDAARDLLVVEKALGNEGLNKATPNGEGHGGSTLDPVDGDEVVDNEDEYDVDGSTTVDPQGKANPETFGEMPAVGTTSAVEAGGTTNAEGHTVVPKKKPVVSTPLTSGPPKKMLDSPNMTKGLKQVWVRETDEIGFTKKAEALAYLERSDAEATVAKVASTADTLVEKLKEEISKRQFTVEQRKKAAAEGVAEPDGSYPIKDEADFRNAVHAYGRSKDKAKTKSHIIARAKSLGLTHLLPKGWDGSTKKFTTIEEIGLKKGLPTVARFACLIDELCEVKLATKIEAREEGDDSPLPQLLFQNIDDLCATLRMMVEEETHELTNGQDVDEYDKVEAMEHPSFAYAMGLADNMFKAARKYMPQKIVDAVLVKKALDAKEAKEELAKAESLELRLERTRNEALTKKIDDLTDQMDNLLTMVKEIADQPLPLPQTMAVSKDGGIEETPEMLLAKRIASDPEFASLHFIKQSYSAPKMFESGAR